MRALFQDPVWVVVLNLIVIAALVFGKGLGVVVDWVSMGCIRWTGREEKVPTELEVWETNGDLQLGPMKEIHWAVGY